MRRLISWLLLITLFHTANPLHAESAQDILAEFHQYKAALEEEFAAFQKINREETLSYQQKVRQKWDVAEMSNKTLWIEYVHDFNQKNRVDFNKGTISITRIQNAGLQKQPLQSILSELLLKTSSEAFRDDTLSQAIEARSRQEISNLQTAEPDSQSILLPIVTGKENPSEAELNAVIEQMLLKKKLTGHRSKKGQKLVTLTVPLHPSAPQKRVPDRTETRKLTHSSVKPSSNGVQRAVVTPAKTGQDKPRLSTKETTDNIAQPGFDLPARARKLADFVRNQSSENDIAPAVIYAIMEAESSFNPMAKSGIPAYGLMQIVPVSAGQDATKKLFGEPKILAPSYLYNSEKNIQIGVTYLHILYYRYLKGISDPQSRLYCTIAAYNTGAGNVAKAFTGKMKIRPAVSIINRMNPDDVYAHLLVHLPYRETRNYLKKVNRLIGKYEQAKIQSVHLDKQKSDWLFMSGVIHPARTFDDG